jgi:hypothetical protein
MDSPSKGNEESRKNFVKNSDSDALQNRERKANLRWLLFQGQFINAMAGRKSVFGRDGRLGEATLPQATPFAMRCQT